MKRLFINKLEIGLVTSYFVGLAIFFAFIDNKVSANTTNIRADLRATTTDAKDRLKDLEQNLEKRFVNLLQINTLQNRAILEDNKAILEDSKKILEANKKILEKSVELQEKF